MNISVNSSWSYVYFHLDDSFNLEPVILNFAWGWMMVSFLPHNDRSIPRHTGYWVFPVLYRDSIPVAAHVCILSQFTDSAEDHPWLHTPFRPNVLMGLEVGRLIWLMPSWWCFLTGERRYIYICIYFHHFWWACITIQTYLTKVHKKICMQYHTGM